MGDKQKHMLTELQGAHRDFLMHPLYLFHDASHSWYRHLKDKMWHFKQTPYSNGCTTSICCWENKRNHSSVPTRHAAPYGHREIHGWGFSQKTKQQLEGVGGHLSVAKKGSLLQCVQTSKVWNEKQNYSERQSQVNTGTNIWYVH